MATPNSSKQKGPMWLTWLLRIMGTMLLSGIVLWSLYKSFAPPRYMGTLKQAQSEAAESGRVAERLMLRAIEEATEDNATPQYRMQIYYGFGELLFREGRFHEAQQQYEQALQWSQKANSKAWEAQSLTEIATCQHWLDATTTGSELAERAVKLGEAGLSADDMRLARFLETLANAYTDKREYAKSDAAWHRALAIARRSKESQDAHVAYCMAGLANLYAQQGKLTEASECFKQAISIYDRLHGPGSDYAENSIKHYAKSLRKGGYEQLAREMESKLDFAS